MNTELEKTQKESIIPDSSAVLPHDWMKTAMSSRDLDRRHCNSREKSTSQKIEGGGRSLKSRIFAWSSAFLLEVMYAQNCRRKLEFGWKYACSSNMILHFEYLWAFR